MAHLISDIDLNIFLKFNRIRALTDEVKMIADAVAYKSDLLQVLIDPSTSTLFQNILMVSDQVRHIPGVTCFALTPFLGCFYTFCLFFCKIHYGRTGLKW